MPSGTTSSLPVSYHGAVIWKYMMKIASDLQTEMSRLLLRHYAPWDCPIMKLHVVFFIAAVLLSARPVAASENIRVAIADDQRTVSLRSVAGLLVAGQSSGVFEKNLSFGPASVGSRPIRIRSVTDPAQVNGKSYRGWVELRKKKNGLLLVINELDIEDYLKGVVASEVPNDWEFEALKAQAVAARTYALYQKRAMAGRPYHILATVSSQVYNGSNGERAHAVRAVRETKGIVIAYQGKVIPAFYHSSCGGHTENASELWGIDMPYLKGVDCECQEIVKQGLWEKRISASAVTKALRRMGYQVGGFSEMSIENITPAGRVKRVTVRSAGRTTVVPGEAFRLALGSTVIPSVFFELELVAGEAVFSGRGSGHGVGLCQWGAKEMAEKGNDYKAILSHYYPGTCLLQLK